MLLEKIESPKALKKLNPKQLRQLAKEIRTFILENVSKTGGHLASNLGIVEITIALHKHFNSPQDKIIWDVGHQSYPHKILTGRRTQFNRLRKQGGLSGFPRREESPHDAFGTGHASTSISAAIGLAEAFKKQKSPKRVVAVIGDGSLTGGIALEAINQIGYLQSPVTIILNDNRMSISPNVGALSLYTKRIEETKIYQQVKQQITSLIEQTKQKGTPSASLLSLKKSLKKIGTPGLLFEKLGINYLGPVDGHHIPSLLKALKAAEKIKGPVLIHARTVKGMGYQEAEKAADRFHGVSPFCLKTGQSLKKDSGRSFSQAFGEKMLELAKRNKKIIAITAAMPSGTGLNDFANQLPDQFYDVGITEQHAATFSAGLAAAGFQPVFAVYSSFLQRSYDQIIHDVCLQDLPVIFAIDRAGLVGEDGPTHHGIFDISYLRHIPNLMLLAPKDNLELEDMLEAALKLKKPVAIRYPRGCGDPLEAPAWCNQNIHRASKKIFKSQLIHQGSSKQLIISVGNLLENAFDLAQKSKGRQKPTIINARSLKPIDPVLLNAIKKAASVTVLEDNVQAGGFGSALLETAAQKGIRTPIISKGIKDCFPEHGEVGFLRKKYLK